MSANNGISRLRNLLRGAHRSEAVDLDGLLLGGMAATLAGLQAVGGGGDVAKVELADGVVLELAVPISAVCHWPIYLTQLCCTVDAYGVADAPSACRKAMAASGWVFGASTIKTPAWMVPHAELSYDDLVAHGFEWAVPTR